MKEKNKKENKNPVVSILEVLVLFYVFTVFASSCSPSSFSPSQGVSSYIKYLQEDKYEDMWKNMSDGFQSVYREEGKDPFDHFRTSTRNLLKDEKNKKAILSIIPKSEEINQDYAQVTIEFTWEETTKTMGLNLIRSEGRWKIDQNIFDLVISSDQSAGDFFLSFVGDLETADFRSAWDKMTDNAREDFKKEGMDTFSAFQSEIQQLMMTKEGRNKILSAVPIGEEQMEEMTVLRIEYTDGGKKEEDKVLLVRIDGQWKLEQIK